MGSSVCVTTDYGLDGPGIESRWVREFPSVQTDPRVHPGSSKMGTGSFPRVKCGRGVLLTTHHLLAPRSWKSRAIPLPPGRSGRAENLAHTGIRSPDRPARSRSLHHFLYSIKMNFSNGSYILVDMHS